MCDFICTDDKVDSGSYYMLLSGSHCIKLLTLNDLHFTVLEHRTEIW